MPLECQQFYGHANLTRQMECNTPSIYSPRPLICLSQTHGSLSTSISQSIRHEQAGLSIYLSTCLLACLQMMLDPELFAVPWEACSCSKGCHATLHFPFSICRLPFATLRPQPLSFCWTPEKAALGTNVQLFFAYFLFNFHIALFPRGVLEPSSGSAKLRIKLSVQVIAT